MSDHVRLTTGIEVAALRRKVEAEGGSATILKRGDEERGAVLLLVASKGVHYAALERLTSLEGKQTWQSVGPSNGAGSIEITDFLAKRSRFDTDMWAVELDVADPQRFIAETLAQG